MACGVGDDHPLFGPAYVRSAEICRADDEWSRARGAAVEGLEIDAAQGAYDDAVGATFDAAKELLEMRPRTLAGLRAMVMALFEAGTFEDADNGRALSRLVVEAPALMIKAA